jgi:vesicle coat complex subunit
VIKTAIMAVPKIYMIDNAWVEDSGILKKVESLLQNTNATVIPLYRINANIGIGQCRCCTF